jgi:hypothetical protein
MYIPGSLVPNLIITLVQSLILFIKKASLIQVAVIKY